MSTEFLLGFPNRYLPTEFLQHCIFSNKTSWTPQASFLAAGFLEKGILNNISFSKSLWSSRLRCTYLRKLAISPVSLMDESSLNKQALLNVPQYISSEPPVCLFPRESLVFPNRFLQSILGRVSCPYWSTMQWSIRLDLSVRYLRVMLILLDTIKFSSPTSLRYLLIPQKSLLSAKRAEYTFIP